MYKLLKVFLCCLLLVGCTHQITKERSADRRVTTYRARHGFLLSRVERPEKASQRYGPPKLETLSAKLDYQYVFEDELVRVRWAFRSNQMAFSLESTDAFEEAGQRGKEGVYALSGKVRCVVPEFVVA